MAIETAATSQFPSLTSVYSEINGTGVAVIPVKSPAGIEVQPTPESQAYTIAYPIG